MGIKCEMLYSSVNYSVPYPSIAVTLLRRSIQNSRCLLEPALVLVGQVCFLSETSFILHHALSRQP
jgi:hypothetical protein